MTDRLKGCWVAFEHDIREDDAEVIINAIKMIKGVADVKTSVADSDDWMNRTQIRNQLIDQLFEVLKK